MRQRFSKRMRFVSSLLTAAMVFTFLPFSAFAAGGVTGGYIITSIGLYRSYRKNGTTSSFCFTTHNHPMCNIAPASLNGRLAFLRF